MAVWIAPGRRGSGGQIVRPVSHTGRYVLRYRAVCQAPLHERATCSAKDLHEQHPGVRRRAEESPPRSPATQPVQAAPGLGEHAHPCPPRQRRSRFQPRTPSREDQPNPLGGTGRWLPTDEHSQMKPPNSTLVTLSSSIPSAVCALVQVSRPIKIETTSALSSKHQGLERALGQATVRQSIR